MAASLHHIAMTLSNLSENGTFYEELATLLHLKLNKFSDRVWGIGGMNPELLLYDASAEMKENVYRYGAPGFHHLAFQVSLRDDVDSVFTWLGEWTAKGARLLDAPQEYPQYAEGYYAVYFTDPCGMKLEVAHIPNSVHEV